MNVEDRHQLDALKVEINKDIALAISSFKIWLMATILSNVVLIGIPALFVFFSTQNTSNSAYTLAENNKEHIDKLSKFCNSADARLAKLEDFLSETEDFELSKTLMRRDC